MTYKYTKTKHIFLILFAVISYFIYVMMSDIYPFLPPLIGVLFMIFHRNYNDRFYISAIIVACLLFFEFDKMLLAGIIPCIFFIVQFFIARQLESVLLANVFFVFIYVCMLYLLYFFFLLLCNMLFKTTMLAMSSIYIYYFFIDCFFTLLYYYITTKE